jgi:hypothetical protein
MPGAIIQEGRCGRWRVHSQGVGRRTILELLAFAALVFILFGLLNVRGYTALLVTRVLRTKNALTSPSFCTSSSERVYITAMGCEIELGGTRGLQAAGAGGL